MRKTKPKDYIERPPETAGDPTLVQTLLAQEKVPVPDYLKLVSPAELGDEDLAIDRYTCPEFFRREAQRLWPRVWQFVTREENIPQRGDYVVYDIVDDSVVVIRGEDGVIRAFINSCLHRGRALRTADGCVAQLRCPFHGFTWDLAGEMKSMPCVWDFPQLSAEQLRLPQLRVETWAGFVFINFDAGAPPLHDYLGVLPEHFARYPLAEYFTAIHVQKPVPCNWKVGQEAFVESMHARSTHPDILSYTADVDSQYDVFGDHISRTITPFGVPSSHLEGCAPERTVRDVLAMAPGAQEHEAFAMPPGMSAREYIGERNRALFGQLSGADLSGATWAELQDAILYSIFPNTQVWVGYYGNLVYRFLPDGADPDRCLFDVRVLARVPDGSPRPPASPLRRLAGDQPFASIAEWGGLGRVFDEDMRNLFHMTKGLKASKKGAVSLAHYQESRIRHHHHTLDKYLNGGRP